MLITMSFEMKCYWIPYSEKSLTKEFRLTDLE